MNGTFQPVRSFNILLLLLCLFVTFPVGSIEAVAQSPDEDRIASVTSTAIELSRQQESGELLDLYDRLATDARNLLPRQAFVNWAESGEMGIPVDDPAIENVSFEDWTWDVNGETYDDAAIVTYSQVVERNGVEATESGERVFVHDGQRWRWFPAMRTADIESLVVALEDEPNAYEPAFRRAAYVRIDRFWENVFSGIDLEYTSLNGIVPVTREPFETGCGMEDQIAIHAIYYCVLDATVYYDPDFKDQVVDLAGQYGWTMIVSHEWGHHIQALLGLDIAWDPELDNGLYPIEIELQADCLAGVYAQDALALGLIDEEEIDSAERITSLSGDTPGTDWDDYDAHGTSDQRVQSFYTGFEDGFTGCHIDLEDYAS